MNEILTAKEWLEKETNTEDICRTGSDMCIISGKECHDFMERYANYRTKMLEEKFSKYWKETEMKVLELEGKLSFIENIPKDKNYTQLL